MAHVLLMVLSVATATLYSKGGTMTESSMDEVTFPASP